MIGISIHADSIRAVRITKGKKCNVKQYYAAPLYDGDIIQGKIRNKEGFIEALEDIRQSMRIGSDEEVFIGIPDATAKIGSFSIPSSIQAKEDIINSVPIIGNRNSFQIEILFVSGDYKIYTNPENEEEFQMMKTISYCAVPQKIIGEYAEVISSTGFNIVTLEPNGLALFRYLQNKVDEPFIILETEYDYTSYLMFSDKNGALKLTSSDLGIKNLLSYEVSEDGEITDSTINFNALTRFSNRIKLVEEYYKKNALSPEDADISSIVFLNTEKDFLVDKIQEDYTSTINVCSSESIFPDNVSSKGQMPEDYYNYFIAMVIAMNDGLDVFASKRINPLVEANFAPSYCVEDSSYKNMKKKVSMVLTSLVAISAIYLLGNVGINLQEIYSKADAEKVTPELQSKYEEAQKQEKVMKDNIMKYNTVAAHKNNVAPYVDKVVQSKPENVYISKMDINLKDKSKRLVLECSTNSTDASMEFLQNLKKDDSFKDAQITNTQSKENLIAFQINVPMKKDDKKKG